jgi:hypothetical protein
VANASRVRKVVANAIVPKPSGLGSWRVLEIFAVYKDSSNKNIKSKPHKKNKKSTSKYLTNSTEYDIIYIQG